MAYDRGKIYNQALKCIENGEVYFIDDVVGELPISRSTFYNWFPEESDELDNIKELLHKNKVKTKAGMRRNWLKSENPTLQVALMKLLATDEEAHRLNGTRQSIEHSGEMKGNEPRINLIVDGKKFNLKE